MSETDKAIASLWKNLPVGLGKDFNTVLNSLERAENDANHYRRSIGAERFRRN